MAFMDTLLRLERLAHLIKRKSTGTREELAQKMDVSVRTVDNLVQQLRDMCEVEIYFCKERGSYCYTGEVIVRFEFVVGADCIGETKGGSSFISDFLWGADFLRGGGGYLYR